MSLLTRRRHPSPTDKIPTDQPDSSPTPVAPPVDAPAADPCTPIGEVRWRQSVRVAGRVRSVRVQPWADIPTLECTLVDPTGGITVVFLGRREIAGIHPGSRLQVEGVAGAHHGKLAMLNADYTLLET